MCECVEKVKPFKEKYEKLETACKDLIHLYRDYMTSGGFVGAYRVKEWVVLCELVGEPTEWQGA